MPVKLVPDAFVVPTSFEGDGYQLEPLGPAHNERDHEAWMSSIEHIRATPGLDQWTWPQPMSLEDNLKDLEEHAREFHDREAFTYSILDGDEVIGCIDIYPPKVDGTDARVHSWVRQSRAEMDVVVWRAMSAWLANDWPFEHLDYAPRD